jgi:hypothetical protein
MQQASENLEHARRQAEVLACSMSYQALQTDKKLARNYDTMKLL